MRTKLALLVTLSLALPAGAETAYQLLQASPPPNFRAGYTLPRLTRWGWAMAFETRKELCERWGYCLEWGGYATSNAVTALDNPASIESQLCALTASDPARYPLCVLVDRPFFATNFQATLPEAAWCHNAQGARLNEYSPIMPDSVYQRAGEGGAAPLARIRQVCPISIVLNGGEYGLNVYGWAGTAWNADPAVVAARGSQSWFAFISDRKAHYEQFVTDATLAQAPELDLYLWYSTSGDPNRTPSGGAWQWVWDYASMRTISTLPNSSLYYGHYNSGWTGSQDMLSQALNCTAYQLTFGQPLSYNWVSGGWTTNTLSDDAHYMGWLKCYYTAGMIGGIAGYFSYPPGGFTGDVGPAIPNWLQQMMALGHVHALFSHVEDFARRGDLLPGPNRHRWSTDLPAYEFPTGDATARVLARRHRDRPEWLICAWAAGGADRNVTVTLPELGSVTLFARATATLYRAKPGPVLLLLDANGMQPSAGLHDIMATNGPNGSISPAGNVVVPDGASETFTFTPDSGCQIANVVADGVSIGARLSYTFANVATNHTLAVNFAVGTNPPVITSPLAATGTVGAAFRYVITADYYPTGFAVAGLPAGLSFDATNGVISGTLASAGTRYVTITASNPFGSDSRTLALASLYAITATAGAGGSIAPVGIVPVAGGGSQTFTIMAGSLFEIADVQVDGVSAGAVSVYTFTNVTTNYTLAASFAALLAPRGTPLWWLAQYGWTDDVAAAETADADGDAVAAWREYQAGTDPTDPLSRPDWNTVPYAESFENLAGWGGVCGPVFGHMGWSSSAPADDQSRITNLVYALSVSNRPLPAATHTNVVRLSTAGATLRNSFGPGYDMGGGLTCFDMASQWVPDDFPPEGWTPTDSGIKCGVYANASSNLAIYHGIAAADGTLLSNVVEDTAVRVDPANWYRLTIAIDATATNPVNVLAMFRVSLNGAAVTNGAAYPEGWKKQFNATGLLPPVCASGTWFRLATANAQAKTLKAMDLDGWGCFDDIVVTNGDPFAASPSAPWSGIIFMVR